VQLTIVARLKVCAAPPPRLQGMVLLINQRDNFITTVVVPYRTGIKGGFAHSIPRPCRSPAMPCVNSHTPCRAPALLQECRVLRESPRGSRKHPNYWSNSLTDRPFCSVLLPLFTVVGMDRSEDDWYAFDNNLRGIPRGSRKKPNAGG